jgi:hypothetical protein
MSEKSRTDILFRDFVSTVVQGALLSKGYKVCQLTDFDSTDLIVSKPGHETFSVGFKSVGSHRGRAKSVLGSVVLPALPLYHVQLNSGKRTVSVAPELMPFLSDTFEAFKVKTA